MIEGFGAIAGLVLSVWPTVGGGLPAPASLPGPTPVVAPAAPREEPSALLSLGDDELRRRIEADPSSLGSLSIGAPSGGFLLNPVALPADPRWLTAPNADSWGTAETIAAIQLVIDTVHELYTDTPALFIGDISTINGGRLKRHETHQVGRDVDFGFFYKAAKGTWFTPGTAANLDLARNWALVRALIVRTDVEAILLDTRIQRLLYNYALGIGEEKDWLDHVFQFARGVPDAIVRHVVGHRTHYHVRFYSPVAQEMGRRAHPTLVELKIVKPPVYSVPYVVRTGDTLGAIARRYGTSVRAIMQANGLTSTQIRAGRVCRIPVRTPAPPQQALVMPHRLLPPQTPLALSSIEWPTAETLYGPASER